MEIQSQSRPQHQVVRQLASLKVLSRLIGHELHAQGSTKSITLSREETQEIQTTIDLFIEEVARRMQHVPAGAAPVQAGEPQLVGGRN